VEAFKEQQAGHNTEDGGQMASPLLVQAEAFAAYLDPPAPVKGESAALPEVDVASRDVLASTPAVRPEAPSVNFRVIAVSCYPDRPERSMALLCASSDSEDEARWVKEGTQVGHFVVHEIRKGLVVLRNGEQRRELAVERRHLRRTLVRNVRPGTRQVSAGVDSAAAVLPAPAGPNGVELSARPAGQSQVR
jgi:hypothetical protein